MLVSVFYGSASTKRGHQRCCRSGTSACYGIATNNQEQPEVRLPVKQVSQKGLSASELDKLHKITGKELTAERTECAVCLDEIEGEQVASAGFPGQTPTSSGSSSSSVTCSENPC
ncbi:hypothetical protein L3X38_006547 [Prunus dulcis]|uniref:RING/U-box superfamily protein n=1 Tax=Prunus dulcis TaxID=3755 RepID=A0AAD4ZSX0_PRUDU|nr:hypothetical protein L3X38_006547 [Prunus dulcis]